MAPKGEDDWSDSDDEVTSDVETSVQLGIPDGLVDTPEDLLDATVSRIGGHPAFITSPEPPISSALCKNCSKPMELLLQVWCPHEDSPNDRALYIWGCANGTCQKKEGSIRAWRGLRHNKKYAEKLAKRLAAQHIKEEAKNKASAEAAQRQNTPKANPFSLKPANQSNPFALGTQVFGSPAPERVKADDGEDSISKQPEETHEEDADSEGSEEIIEEDDADELAERMAAATLESSEWTSVPAYAPLYLSTVSEYLPPAPKTKIPASAMIDEDDLEKKAKDGGWAMEGYENSLEVDHAFERFHKRVSFEGEQCLRYELGGTPLPFASDKTFNKLFPAPPSPSIPVTKGQFAVLPVLKRTYNPSAILPCPRCKSRRVFECQLMPNLLNVLKRTDNLKNGKRKLTDEERRQEVMKELKGGKRVGMEWGTCMIFSCEKDCSVEGKGGWQEEIVLSQWDE